LLPKKKTSSGFEFVSGLADGASAMPAKWSRPVFSFGFYERKISRAFGRDPAKFGIEGWLRMHSPAPQDWAAAANAARAWNPGMTKSGPAAERSRRLLVQATRSGAAVPFSSTASRFSRARCPMASRVSMVALPRCDQRLVIHQGTAGGIHHDCAPLHGGDPPRIQPFSRPLPGRHMHGEDIDGP